MKKQEMVVRLINSIGRKFFIDHYEIFKSDLPNREKIEKISKNESENSPKTRVNCANKIFKNNLQLNALLEIADYSEKIDIEIQAKAREILKNELYK